MKKLFENVSGNNFRLITENMIDTIKGSELVREGIKKVFANSDMEVSYYRLESVGFGYIKDINEAKKYSIQAARILAEEYGYQDDENQQKFVKSVTNEVETPVTPVQTAQPAPDKFNQAIFKLNTAADKLKTMIELCEKHNLPNLKKQTEVVMYDILKFTNENK